ncbi:MAG: hypothetical protein Q4A07_08730 [Coriobacteriales bacterium]|nr:hypothetical protein [Coriobacteriales bacterium]
MRARIREIADEYGVEVMDPVVRNTVSARKAQRHGMPLRDFAPRSTAAVDYERVVDWYLEKLGHEGSENDGR